jgi:D-alanyl-lipoteichoic acid acyltransferase DltB (MBOAT superfamily)
MLFNSFTFIVFFAVVLAIVPWLSHRRQNLFLLAAVTVSLGVLGAFKYYDFFAASAAGWMEDLGWNANVRVLRLALPIGISFYTFRAIGFTADLYEGRLSKLPRFSHFALFVAFFPQLAAGPIDRAAQMLPQIEQPRRLTGRRFAEGLALMLFGCFQKVVLADNLAVPVDRVFDGPAPTNGWVAILSVYAFAVQILCDFGGYSNMARGAARCLGFESMVNFFSPYLAANPSEFWRRWHISLSTWLRDYLYIPLGGNRGSRWRVARNLMVTMLLWVARLAPGLLMLVWLEVLAYRKNDPEAFLRLPAVVQGVLYALCFYAIVLFGAHDAQAFIYLQF